MAKLIQFSTEGSRFDGEFRWQAAGMGYVFCPDDPAWGFIVVDGGETEQDTEDLLKLLEEKVGTDKTGCKPVVALWILTHPHPDHCKNLVRISENEKYSSRVDVAALCYSVPDNYREVYGDSIGIDRIAGQLDCDLIRPKRGEEIDEIYAGGFIVRIFSTYENYSPEDINDLSLVFSVECQESGRKAMFTGDSYEIALDYVLKNTDPDLLKSDFIQVAHHGLNGGLEAFYEAVGAETALVPISNAGEKVGPQDYKVRNDAARKLAKTEYRSGEGTVELDF